jgi:GntR family transcriptional regulator
MMNANADRLLEPHMVDENLPTPLYHQIYLLLRERIVSGGLSAGELLPGEQEMARMLGVSRITVKRALNELAARGLVDRRRGRGTSVAGSAVIPLVAGAFDTLVESLERMGLQTDVQLLDAREVAADATVAERLEIKVGAIVQRAVRFRQLNGQPFSHLVNYIPLSIANRYTHEELASTSMLTLLERAGAAPQEAEQWISAVGAASAIASALDVAPGAPLLRVDRVMRGPRRKPVQYIEAHYRPDRFHYHFRTQRNGRGNGEWAHDV